MTVSEMSGSTRVYAVLGDPVLQVRAPGLLNPVIAEVGLDAVVVPVYVRPQDFAGDAADIVVNVTPLGLRPGDSLPFDPLEVRPDAVVADIVMNPHETALLRRAAAVGRRVHHGIHMLREQVPCYREFFGWRCND